MKTERNKQHLVLAGICLLLGISIVLVAAKIIPIPDEDANAPMWILGLCGAVFFMAGVMILAGPESRLAAFGAMLICICFGAVGAWVALFSEPGSITGGLPFLSNATNETIGRWMFGLGSVISFLIALIALRQVIGQAPR